MILIYLMSLPTWGAQKHMQKAFADLEVLFPYIQSPSKFMDKKNEKLIHDHITGLSNTFLNLKHEGLIKKDIFSPSYTKLREDIDQIQKHIKQGEKEFVRWKLEELTAACVDCHSRIPKDYPPSLNYTLKLNQSNFESLYNLGIAHLILRNYFEAKNNFVADIDQKMLQDLTGEITPSLKQLLLVELKIKKDPESLVATFEHYRAKKLFPDSLKKVIATWQTGLKLWKTTHKTNKPIHDDKELDQFIAEHLKDEIWQPKGTRVKDIELLLINGTLSEYFFSHPETKKGGLLNYWIGKTGDELEVAGYQSNGKNFFLQCIFRYSNEPIAKECLNSYRDIIKRLYQSESQIPSPLKLELDFYQRLIKTN